MMSGSAVELAVSIAAIKAVMLPDGTFSTAARTRNGKIMEATKVAKAILNRIEDLLESGRNSISECGKLSS
jgi:hypothetical protein